MMSIQKFVSALKSFLSYVVTAAVGAGIAILVAWYAGALGISPAKPAAIDRSFIPLGKGYLPELGRAYAVAWEEGAKALEAGKPVSEALKGVAQSWDAGRSKLFDGLITPAFAKVVPEGQTDLKEADRAALVRAWRGLAAGLNPSKR